MVGNVSNILWDAEHPVRVIRSYEDAVDQVLADVRRTLIDRQRKYGHKNIERSGERGLLVRLNDKLARMENNLDSDGRPIVEATDETIEDTAIDIAGYGVIWIMWIRGLWGKYPLEEDRGMERVDGTGTS